MKSNTPIILIGLAVAIVGFAGVLLFGQVVNPPPTPGAVLSREMLGIDDARLNRQMIAGLVLEGARICPLERIVRRHSAHSSCLSMRVSTRSSVA
jgi:hypothetical protein